jgi:GT2 family glycosyltransferase
MNNPISLVSISSHIGALAPVPDVAIIIVNWNRCDDTLACLASLSRLEYPAYKIIIVDNGSTDGSVMAIRTAYPQITLIETGDNLGYVGGNNIGLEHARTLGVKYALLLNNDTEVAPNFLNLLLQAAEADPRVGIVGPLIYYFDRPEVIWSAGGAIDWQRGDTHMLGLNQLNQGQFGVTPQSVDFVTGCVLLLKWPSSSRSAHWTLFCLYLKSRYGTKFPWLRAKPHPKCIIT